MTTQVYFVGAGPGDTELLTIKARKVIERADVIIYADSLINPDICAFAKAGAEIHRSAALSLEEIIEIITSAVAQGKVVARLQSGDPAIYGAIQEQMAALDAKCIGYEIVPGVSSLFAAAASLKTELTVPELSQTVIITRMEGRTPVPSRESLRSLAEHQCTLAIFLSISRIEMVVTELLEGGYRGDTPAAVVYRASWEDEMVIRAPLSAIADRVKAAGVAKQALILVGNCLKERGETRSWLYDKDFK
ncbi:MAG: precorrin-4 C(11)-methyltransferase [Chloroflexi bacterium]|nr:precorrin-4 C(11)-methyltransferase [Chloroflexota bacterium]